MTITSHVWFPTQTFHVALESQHFFLDSNWALRAISSMHTGDTLKRGPCGRPLPCGQKSSNHFFNVRKCVRNGNVTSTVCNFFKRNGGLKFGLFKVTKIFPFYFYSKFKHAKSVLWHGNKTDNFPSPSPSYLCSTQNKNPSF